MRASDYGERWKVRGWPVRGARLVAPWTPPSGFSSVGAALDHRYLRRRGRVTGVVAANKQAGRDRGRSRARRGPVAATGPTIARYGPITELP